MAVPFQPGRVGWVLCSESLRVSGKVSLPVTGSLSADRCGDASVVCMVGKSMPASVFDHVRMQCVQCIYCLYMFVCLFV